MPTLPEVERLLAYVATAAAEHDLCPMGTEIGRLDAYAEIYRIYSERGEDIPADVERRYLELCQLQTESTITKP